MTDDKGRPAFEGQIVTKGYGQGDTQLIGTLLLLALLALFIIGLLIL